MISDLVGYTKKPPMAGCAHDAGKDVDEGGG